MLKLCICLVFLAVGLAKEVPKGSNFNFSFDRKHLLALNQSIVDNLRYVSSINVAVLNDYADEVLGHLNIFIKVNGLEPINIESFKESFRWTIFAGHISAYNGILDGVSSFMRTGDVLLYYNYPYIKIKMPLGFSRIGIEYDYEAKFMGIGPYGKLKGYVEGCQYMIDIDVNMLHLRGHLNQFKLNKLGKLTVKFYGGILETMVNIFISVVKPIIKPIVKIVIEIFVVNGLNDILNYANNVICRILDDCGSVF